MATAAAAASSSSASKEPNFCSSQPVPAADKMTAAQSAECIREAKKAGFTGTDAQLKVIGLAIFEQQNPPYTLRNENEKYFSESCREIFRALGGVHLYHQYPQSLSWKPRTCDVYKNESFAKAQKNAQKAFELAVGRSKMQGTANVYAAPVPTIEDQRQQTHRFQFEAATSQSKGQKRKLEDAVHVKFNPEDGSLLTIVADGAGEGSHEMAQAICKRFPGLFKKMRERLGKAEIHNALEMSIWTIDRELREQWPDAGCTLNVSFLTSSGLLYSATVGDCEANIHRTINSESKSIPVAATQTWADKEPSMRLVIGHALRDVSWTNRRVVYATAVKLRGQINKEAASYRENPDPKSIRYGIADGNGSRELNTPGAIGHKKFKPIVSSMPIITVQKLEAGDVFVSCSDGLKDAFKKDEAQLVHLIQKTKNLRPDEICSSLIEAAHTQVATPAMGKAQRRDDISVIVVKVLPIAPDSVLSTLQSSSAAAAAPPAIPFTAAAADPFFPIMPAFLPLTLPESAITPAAPAASSSSSAAAPPQGTKRDADTEGESQPQQKKVRLS